MWYGQKLRTVIYKTVCVLIIFKAWTKKKKKKKVRNIIPFIEQSPLTKINIFIWSRSETTD